jgi:hypothetical protein
VFESGLSLHDKVTLIEFIPDSVLICVLQVKVKSALSVCWQESAGIKCKLFYSYYRY